MTIDSGFDTTPPVEQEMAEIDNHLAILKGFETDRTNPQVEKARTRVQSLVRKFKPLLDEMDIVATFHGSIQYNDPINLDPDLTLLAEKESPGGEKTAQNIANSLNLGWSDISDSKDMDVASYSIEEILATDADAMSDVAIPGASYILSSMPVFPEDAPELNILREKMKTSLRTNDVLRKGVIKELADVIVTRQERRQPNPSLDNE